MNDWIKIEPGGRCPAPGQLYVCLWDDGALTVGRDNGTSRIEWNPHITHWMPIVPPSPDPDACARWLNCEGVTDPMCRNWARAGWNAALEQQPPSGDTKRLREERDALSALLRELVDYTGKAFCHPEAWPFPQALVERARAALEPARRDNARMP